MKPLNSDITTKIAQQIGLAFVSEQEAEGNVCMANSTEVRIEFKEIFSTIDVFDYFCGVLHSLPNQANQKDVLEIESLKIPLPKDRSAFQEFKNIGSKMRQNPLLENLKNKIYFAEYTLYGAYVVAQY